MTKTVTLDTYTSVTTKMYVWNCPSCGIVYGVPVGFADDCRRTGKSYYCPNGHSLSWDETEADKLRKKLQRAEADRDYWQAEERRERERAQRLKREKAAVKGQLTKAKKRIGKGVCPCCNRHFVNVERHMENKHPEYANG